MFKVDFIYLNLQDKGKRGHTMGIIVKSFDIGQGDCFLIKVTDDLGRYFNLLVDCGENGMEGVIKDALTGQRLNGIVVTHVDDDHIKGVIDLIEGSKMKKFLSSTFILYNKYDDSLITYEKGRKLYEEVRSRMSQKLLIKSYARNYNRENKAIERKRKAEELPVYILSKGQRKLMSTKMLEKDNVYITLLSPDIDTLKKLMRDWKKVSESKKRINENSLIKNKSSISFLLEFNNKKILMTGDGEIQSIYESLQEIKDIHHIDYIKIPHHGARNNNCGIEKFVDSYSCTKYGVTIPETQDGEMNHPDRNIIGMLHLRGCQIHTATDYICRRKEDVVNYIEKRSEINL